MTFPNRMRRWVNPAIVLVSDRSLLAGRELEEVCSQAVDGGVTAVQLREKDLPSRELYETTMTIRAVLQGRALVLVNDRADVAAVSGSDGVHLPERCLPVHAVRTMVGDGCILGRSVHSLDAAVRAEREGADYVQIGAVFATASHPADRPGGIELVSRIAEAVSIPVIAVGGIDASNAASVIKAGADGVAVIRAILAAENARDAAAAISSAVHEAYAA